jgi:cyclopropane-fatty-acyl-phospholipid synthase
MIHALQDWIESAVANLPLPDHSQLVTVLDLGSSEGRNAIHMMETIVAGLRQRTGQPLQTIYSDLPSNNFNQLFANLEEARCAGLVHSGVYASAVGGSFYGPLLPPGTVHLATSFNSIQWLDQLPAETMPDFVTYRRPHPPRPGLAVSPKAAAAFKQQAEQDLFRFLECRARELVPGGTLLLASPGNTDQACMSDGVADVLNDACLDLVADGRLERDQYQRLKIPIYFRTVAELLAPLDIQDSPVRAAFAIDRAEALELPTPFLVALRSGNVAAFADAYTGFIRAVSEPIVKAALQQPGEEEVMVERLYERIRARLLTEPERYLFRYIVVAALLTRL